jgi:hypothetical protein
MVRGEPIWTERERVVVLTDDGGWRRCTGGNQRGGGVSGGRSRRGGRVGIGERGELKLWRGRGPERSDAPTASSNRRARGGEREKEMGRGSALCHVEEGKWEREGLEHGDQQHGAKDAVDNGPRPSGAGGGAVARIGDSGTT